MNHTPKLLRDLKTHYFEKKIHIHTVYWVYLISAFLLTLPILIANVDYIDDNARRVSGYYDWGSLGRYATETMMRLITFSGDTMSDPGRLMQILSIPVLAYGGYIVARFVNGNKRRISIGNVLIGLVMVINPFLIANLSFRYDSLSMILAYTAAIMSGIVAVECRGSRFGIFRAIVLLVLSAALYQPMVMVMPTVAVLMIVSRILDEGRMLLNDVMSAVSAFFGGMIVYYGTLQFFRFSNVGGASRGVLVVFDQNWFHNVYENFKQGIEVARLALGTGSGKLLLVVALVLIVSFTIVRAREYIKLRKKSEAFFLVIAPLLLIGSIMGPFVLMDSALTYQVRTLSASVGLLVLLALYVQKSRDRQFPYLKSAGIFVVATVLGYFLTTSFVYGQILTTQRQHDVAVYDELDDYMLRDEAIQGARVVYIGGVPTAPKSVQRNLAKRPLLSRLSIATDDTTWYIWQRLQDEGVTDAAVMWYTQSKEQEQMRRDMCIESATPAYRHRFFSVYRRGDIFVVWQGRVGEPTSFCVAS